jgi:hypothetical protein
VDVMTVYHELYQLTDEIHPTDLTDEELRAVLTALRSARKRLRAAQRPVPLLPRIKARNRNAAQHV